MLSQVALNLGRLAVLWKRKKKNTLLVEAHVVHENSDEHYARTNKLTDRYSPPAKEGASAGSVGQRGRGPRPQCRVFAGLERTEQPGEGKRVFLGSNS